VISKLKAVFAAVIIGTCIGACSAPTPEYNRDAFGTPWADVDGNGCDTRNDVLARDLIDTTIEENCKVTDGLLVDPYDGKEVRLADGIHIDHVVSLKEAWATGAHQWSPKRRLQFANDQMNLLATSASNNMKKGDKRASEWLPEVNVCDYLNRYVDVKVKYDLHVRETTELLLIKEGC